VKMFSERIAERSRRGRCVLPGGYEESIKFRRGADSCRRADLKRLRVISDEKKKEGSEFRKGEGLREGRMYNRRAVRAKKSETVTLYNISIYPEL